MGEDFKEKIKTVGVSLRRGQSKKKPVIDDRDGSVGGYEVEHWDDRQDAHVIAGNVAVHSKTQEGG